MRQITRGMDQDQINEIVEENLAEHHTEEQVTRFHRVTAICKKRKFSKDTLGLWFHSGMDKAGPKRAQEKLYAKPRRSFTPADYTLVQVLDLLEKEGYDVNNATFNSEGKLKISKK